MLGGVLFARVFSHLFYDKDVTVDSKDANPGTANAFTNGGFACGMLTLMGDLGKGFLPVFLYLNLGETSPLGLVIVMMAPVIGHILTPWYHFKGGKGNATSFGVLLGLAPYVIPLGLLIIAFLFYSLVIRVSPNFQRTIVTYVTVAVLMFVFVGDTSAAICIGFLGIAIALITKMHFSKEEREKTKVRFLWMH